MTTDTWPNLDTMNVLLSDSFYGFNIRLYQLTVFKSESWIIHSNYLFKNTDSFKS